MWFDKARLHRGLGTGANLCDRLGDDVQGSWAEISRKVRGSWAAPAQVRPEVTVRPLRRDMDRQRAGDDRNRLHGRTSWQGPGTISATIQNIKKQASLMHDAQSATRIFQYCRRTTELSPVHHSVTR